MSYRPLAALVLAAGEGTRMRSATPKVLHPLCGRPMLLHVVDALTTLPLERVVIVVGHGAEAVTKTVQEQLATELPVEFVEQPVPRGTGDAVSVGLTAGFEDLDVEDDLLVLPGDTPLLRAETLATLATEHRNSDSAATVLTSHLDDPAGYGRVLRGPDGRVARIVEHRDADADVLAVTEWNTGIYCFRRSLLAPALRRLRPENAQSEYYLTDVVEVLRDTGHRVTAVVASDVTEVEGVNDRAQLAAAEANLRARVNGAWMQAGVTMVDPARTYFDVGVELEADVRLLPGTMLEGRTVVGRGTVIGPDSRLVDTVVGEDCVVEASFLRQSEVGDGCVIGPFAHFRPGVRLGDGVKVGDFVELKNSEVGDGAKIPHLAYVGDAEVGPAANLGAGTVTANYDGRDKHRTVIGARVHTGANSVMVAPVTVGDDAVLGAGTVVTRDVPAGALAKGVPARVDTAAPDDAATREDQGSGDE